MAWARADKERAMIVLAAHNGAAGLAVKALKQDHGMGTNTQTLREWRAGEMREFYEKLLEDMPDMTQAIINETLETARMAAGAERLAVEKAMALISSCDDPAKAAKAARDLSAIKATSIKDALTLQGKPTEIIDHDPDKILAGLLRDGVIQAVAPGQEADFELPEYAVRELPSGA